MGENVGRIVGDYHIVRELRRGAPSALAHVQARRSLREPPGSPA